MRHRPSGWHTPKHALPASARLLALTKDKPAAPESFESAAAGGHSLFQDSFFVGDVKGIGDLPSIGPIFLEVVVDRDSGISFAKLYSSVRASNAVDILAGRVLPFFRVRREVIRQIHTPKKPEYLGAPLAGTYETFLAESEIAHITITGISNPYYYLCEHFYLFLLRDFFQPALRKQFDFTLEGLQRDLDAFLTHFNAPKMAAFDPVARPLSR